MYMQGDTERQIYKCNYDSSLELVDQDDDKTSLEYVCVEEGQEENDYRKDNTDILNPKTKVNM